MTRITAEIAERLRRDYSEAGRARAMGDLFRAAAEAFRARRGLSADAPLPGASRALLGMGSPCAEPTARALVLARALSVAELEPRTTWTIETLAALARVHEPARASALRAARETLSTNVRKSAAANALARASIACIATLVSLVAPHERSALFVELLAACEAFGFADYERPTLLARTAPGLSEVSPDVLLDAIASSHEYYRALAYALCAGALSPPSRARAIAAALENEADPSLCDARAFVAMAPHLSAEHYPRAIELASRLHSSPSFGATAMRALLPGWAALGHVEDALARARKIAHDGERGVALALSALYVRDASECDRLVSEGLALVKTAGFGVELLARELVPLGFGAALEEASPHRSERAMLELCLAAEGEERRAFLATLAKKGDPTSLSIVLRELPREIVLPRWLTAFCEGFADDRDEPFEDEGGSGLTDWMPLVPLLAGDEGAMHAARAIAP